MNPAVRTAIVSLLVAGAFAIAPAAQAATISVTTTADELNTDGDCSLREAIRSANSDGVDPHDACASGSGADTIALPAGTYMLSVGPAGDNAALTGDLDITSDVTLDPTGVVVIDGGALDRVFMVIGSGALTASDLTIRGGKATGVGGGIYSEETVTLTGVTVTNNEAAGGGGIWAEFIGTTTLTNVTVSGNRTDGDGGGLRVINATATLNNVTITDNTADNDANGSGDGGGVAIDSTATVNLKNTILGDNRDASTGGDPRHPDCSGTITSEGYNLIEEATGCTLAGTTTGNVVGQDPRLSQLADNEGSTQTHALQKNSPAIDTGNSAAAGSGGSACEATDQRGVPRTGSRCDMGAYELVQCLGVDVTVIGTDGPDTLTGTSKADGILALGGNDVVNAGGGKDAVCAGPGDDTVRGGDADDEVIGEAGNDVLGGDPGSDTLSGQDGNDRLTGAGGNDLLRGQGGRDRLKGKAGDDTLKGGAKPDRLDGGGGVDTCRGGGGRDRIRRCE